MKEAPFIFSERLSYKLSRHLAFWIAALFGQGLLQLGVRPLFNVAISHNMLMEFTLLPLLYLPGQLMLVYSLLYFVLPEYVLHARYKKAMIWFVILTILSAFISELSYAFLNTPFRAAFMDTQLYDTTKTNLTDVVTSHIDWKRFPLEFVFGFRAVINVGGFAIAIKLMKHWYEKEYRNTILQKEKLDAELRSLKAQIHPHFLFNTLNNIYSITETTSPLASDVVLRLSSLLRYILYDCNSPTVTLGQEWKLVDDYIALEKLRYNNLDIKVELPGNGSTCRIAPLLLLPLLENCFKHGTSNMLKAPWINLNADFKDNVLTVKLVNGKSGSSRTDSYKNAGIGLTNLRRRLHMLYPTQHELNITEEENVFIAILKVNLATSPFVH